MKLEKFIMLHKHQKHFSKEHRQTVLMTMKEMMIKTMQLIKVIQPIQVINLLIFITKKSQLF